MSKVGCDQCNEAENASRYFVSILYKHTRKRVRDSGRNIRAYDERKDSKHGNNKALKDIVIVPTLTYLSETVP